MNSPGPANGKRMSFGSVGSGGEHVPSFPINISSRGNSLDGEENFLRV